MTLGEAPCGGPVGFVIADMVQNQVCSLKLRLKIVKVKFRSVKKPNSDNLAALLRQESLPKCNMLTRKGGVCSKDDF